MEHGEPPSPGRNLFREPSKVISARRRRRHERTSAIRLAGFMAAAFIVGWFARDIFHGLSPLFTSASQPAIVARPADSVDGADPDLSLRVRSVKLGTRSNWRDSEDQMWTYKFGSLAAPESWTMAKSQLAGGQQLEVGKSYSDSESSIWEYRGGPAAEADSWRLLTPTEETGTATP